ncbi:Uncharacterized protein Rs2_02082 [Raphanus sativus]|nr:Uncharacterized protein Rs2_02082 [Raphanus sativus]
MDVLILVVVCDGSILGAMPSSCFGYAVSGSSTRIWGFGSLHLARRYDCQKLSLHHPQGGQSIIMRSRVSPNNFAAKGCALTSSLLLRCIHLLGCFVPENLFNSAGYGIQMFKKKKINPSSIPLASKTEFEGFLARNPTNFSKRQPRTIPVLVSSSTNKNNFVLVEFEPRTDRFTLYSKFFYHQTTIDWS